MVWYSSFRIFQFVVIHTVTEMQVQSQEDPLEKDVATHSSSLAWRIPRTEQPSRLQSIGVQRVRTTEAA